MFNGQTSFGLPLIPNFSRLALKLAWGLLCIILFLHITLNIVKAEEINDRTHPVNTQETPVPFQLLFPGYISQHYSSWHQAVDLATGLGMPIKPLAKGKVTWAGYDFFGYGLKVEIDHGNGYKSMYAHMGKIYVSEGQEVEGSNYIGEVGLTGRTTGPHTHLEVLKDSQIIDPETILPAIREYATEADFKPVGGKTLTDKEIQMPTPPKSPQPKEEEAVSNPNIERSASTMQSVNPLKDMLSLNNFKNKTSNNIDFVGDLKLGLK